MKRCIILGASSGIGKAVAEQLIAQGWTVGVAARRTELLDKIKALAPERVTTKAIDVNQENATALCAELIEEMGGIDLFFYSVGIGWQNPNLEEEKELKTIQTNALAFTRMMGFAFRYFADNNAEGHIACISSIAGTKGLGAAPAYSATKAMQTTYIQALEQQALKRKLKTHFTNIQPGFVDTELLSGTHFPLLMQPEKVAKSIIKALNKRKHKVVIDTRWSIITTLWSILPNWIWRKMKV